MKSSSIKIKRSDEQRRDGTRTQAAKTRAQLLKQARQVKYSY